MTTTTAALKSLPAFTALVQAEKNRRALVRRPGGRSLLAANSAECFRLEQEIMRATGCSFNELTSAVLSSR